MRIDELFGITMPLIQAPMAGVQGSALAIAVSNAGGLGSLPCATLSVDTMRREITKIKAKTSRPYNVNFFCHSQPVPDPVREKNWRALLDKYYQEYEIDPASIPTGPGRNPFSAEIAEVLREFEPPIVSFHFGLPSITLMRQVRNWGAKIIASATTLEEARWLESHGVDAIIAQGVEAGGHRGIFLSEDLTTQISTHELVRQMVGTVRLPVIAAGGIANAADVRHAMSLGAAGVQIGTAYLLSPEVTISPMHRAALHSEAAKNTVLTNLFTGRPARGIVNRFIRECGPINQNIPAFPLATAALAPLRAEAENRGSSDFSSMWSGVNNSHCRELPAAEITCALAAGFDSIHNHPDFLKR